MKCQNCQTEITRAISYCNKCGSKLITEPVDDYSKSINRTKVFFFVLLGYIALLHVLKLNSNYVYSIIADLIFAIIVVTFLVLNFNSIKGTLIPKITDYRLLTILCLGLVFLAFIVSHFANYLNESVFNNSNSTYIEHYKDSPLPLLFSIISVGVFPAIFEEIAFRGILFNELKNIVSTNSTIIISTVLFTILHFSLISFLWIFPIGLLFGYLRSKYDNLIYGIIGHFVYNSSIVMIEFINV